MGLYWQTVFYNNIYDTRNSIILGQADKIICNEDIERGYFDKKKLLEKYGDIKEDNISSNSYLVEYITNIYNGVEKIKTAQLKIN